MLLNFSKLKNIKHTTDFGDSGETLNFLFKRKFKNLNFFLNLVILNHKASYFKLQEFRVILDHERVLKLQSATNSNKWIFGNSNVKVIKTNDC